MTDQKFKSRKIVKINYRRFSFEYIIGNICGGDAIISIKCLIIDPINNLEKLKY